MAQSPCRRLRDSIDSVSVLCAFRGTAAGGIDDDFGNYWRADVGGVHSRHTRTVRKPKGNFNRDSFQAYFRDKQ